MPTYTKQSDAVQKIQVESHLIYAIWSQPRAHAEQETGVEVRTSFVGEGAKIKITCYTEKGKKLDKIEGTVLNNRYKGRVVIPDKVKPDDMIYFEAELPKHGLKGESNLIPVRPAIQVTKIELDRQEVKREEVVTNGVFKRYWDYVIDICDSAGLASGFGDSANSCDLKVVAIPTTIKDNKVEMQWEFDYQDSTDQIPTDEEMKPYQKKYANPRFYFVVLVDGIRIGEKKESGLLVFKETVEIVYSEETGIPIGDINYLLHLPDGAQRKGTLDDRGYAKEENVIPGKVKVEFLDDEGVAPL